MGQGGRAMGQRAGQAMCGPGPAGQWARHGKEENTEVFGSVGQICYNTNLKRIIVVCKKGLIQVKDATYENGNDALEDLKKLNNQIFD